MASEHREHVFRAVVLLPLLLAGVAAGCVSLGRTTAEPTRFFVLTSSVEPPADDVEREAPLDAVRLRIEVVDTPEYLETEKIAVRVEENQIEFQELDRWAEPVSVGLLRVLKENLEAFPEIRTVEVAPFSRGERPEHSLSVSVRRFEGDRSGGDGAIARFEVFWRLRPEESGHPASGLYRFAEACDGETYDVLASALSRAALEFSRTLVEEIRDAEKKQRASSSGRARPRRGEEAPRAESGRARRDVQEREENHEEQGP